MASPCIASQNWNCQLNHPLTYLSKLLGFHNCHAARVHGATALWGVLPQGQGS